MNEDWLLMVVFILIFENFLCLEVIRENNFCRVGLLEGKVDLNFNVGVVWLSYSVYGNEVVGSESLMGVVYEFSNLDN